MKLGKYYWMSLVAAIIFLVLVIVFGKKWAGIKDIDDDEIEIYESK